MYALCINGNGNEYNKYPTPNEYKNTEKFHIIWTFLKTIGFNLLEIGAHSTQQITIERANRRCEKEEEKNECEREGDCKVHLHIICVENHT